MRVLITGASSGLGRGLALSLLKKGAFVGGVARNKSNQNYLNQYVHNKPVESSNLLTGNGSMMDSVFMTEFVEKMTEAWGGIDLLIANAGVFGPRADF
ncbi:SDR family oxidoreductase [Synechococcus sp. AH-736-G21]|nr:SDR family oxidoreductase [Synechococcus sp. AH-736-G21]